jgi:hypothetical protein
MILLSKSERRKIRCGRLFPPVKLAVHNHAGTLLDTKLCLQISQDISINLAVSVIVYLYLFDVSPIINTQRQIQVSLPLTVSPSWRQVPMGSITYF